jgi:nitrite reductase/ring-hydroxylating ferredoxin subunit
MKANAAGFVRVCSHEELQASGPLVRQVGGRPLLIVHHQERVHAIDNRCPHMGFPLSRGTVQDGLVTCPWHHARFELCSGGTFDPFADDARTYPCEVRGGDVWVDPHTQRDEVAHQKMRFKDGLEQNIGLVLAKACISLFAHGAEPAELLRMAGTFGATQRHAGWRDGLTILTAMGNILPQLEASQRPVALYHGALHVAANVTGQQPHFRLDPLPLATVTYEQVEGWLRRFAEVRDRDGMERVILTAIEAGCDDKALAEVLLAAVTDHYYLDGGHSIDFINKAFELLDLIGWQHAPEVLPSLLPGITWGTRMEETNSWRSPIDLPAILEPIFTDLQQGRFTGDVHQNGRLSHQGFDALVETLLGSDPHAIAQALANTLREGVATSELSQVVCYAAALRIARFHTSNEFDDWLAVLHTFTAASATHRLLRRAPSLAGLRGLWHVAMHLYLNRFLNTPAATLPTAGAVAGLPEAGDELLTMLLDLTDRRQQTDEAAAITFRYLNLGHHPERLIHTLAEMLLREDAEFHSYQMLEASLSLYAELKTARPDHAPNVLIALARYLAGHAPTDRATTQTYRIALRLQRGEIASGEVM